MCYLWAALPAQKPAWETALLATAGIPASILRELAALHRGKGFAHQARMGIASDHTNRDPYTYRKSEYIVLTFFKAAWNPLTFIRLKFFKAVSSQMASNGVSVLKQLQKKINELLNPYTRSKQGFNSLALFLSRVDLGSW